MKQFIKEGILGNIVSILLSLTIIMVCMYVYCGNDPILYLLLMGFSVIIQVLVFSLYSFIAKKSKLLKFISVLGSFFCICALIVMAIKTGQNTSSVEFFIWFLSPQALVDFSISYIVAIYIIINFFISSTIYYFSAVRYRMTMTFIIAVIPFAFYRKEGEEVPVMFAFLVLMMYVALMIHCRHTNLKSNQKMIIDSGYRKSIIAFLLVSSLLALIIPKPELKIDNSWANYILEYQEFTEYMLSKLGIVSDTSGPHDLYTSSKNIEMYRFSAEEIPLHLKIQTFNDYDYKNNIWKVNSNISAEKSSDSDGDKLSEENQLKPDKGKEILFKDSCQAVIDPRKFYNAIAQTCSCDPEFKEKYGFDEMAPIRVLYKKNISMRRSVFRSGYFMLPNMTYSISTYPKNEPVFFNEEKMVIYKSSVVDDFSAEYYSQDIIENSSFNRFLKSIKDYETFEQLLSDAQEILNRNEITEYNDLIEAYQSDYNNAMENMFSLEDVPESVISLAEKITENCNSPFEKAQKIEKYFGKSGFYYDLAYERTADYSMETLLFKDKRGICSDYATAAALLARCVGIPSRYENGALLQNQDKNMESSVRDTDMHSYPELYIPGFGWMVIEPTIMDEADAPVKISISIITLCITISAIIIIVLFVILYPKIKEKLFRKKIKGKNRSRAFEMILCRIRDLLKLDESLTVEQISKEISAKFSEKYSLSSELMNACLYGNLKINDDIFEQIYSYYTGLYDIIKESKKRRSVEK